jgi:hypothetical protein
MDMYLKEGIEVLAGLTPMLIDEIDKLKSEGRQYHLLEGQFTSV